MAKKAQKDAEKVGKGSAHASTAAENPPASPRGKRGHALTPYHYQPGTTGNPAGKQKGTKLGLRALLRMRLRTQPTAIVIANLQAEGYETPPSTVAEAVAIRLVYMAQEGNMDAIKEVFKQTEPPLQKTIGIGGQDGGPVQFILPTDLSALAQRPDPEDDDEE